MAIVNPSLQQRRLFAKAIPRKTSGRLKPVYQTPQPRKPQPSRNNLKELGYDTYEEYLASALWRDIRMAVLEFRGRFCAMCKEPATEIHHTSYGRKVMLGQDIKPLYPLCRKCHRKIHDNATLAKANKRMRADMKKERRLSNPHYLPTRFLAFWDVYPRKVAKIETRKAWEKAVHLIAKEQQLTFNQAAQWLIERSKLFAKSEQAQSKQFCPYPTTWLNQGRYDDDSAEWEQPEKKRWYEDAENHRF